MKAFGVAISLFFIMWIALMLSSASAAKFPLSFSSSMDNNPSSSSNLSILPGNDTATSLCLAYPCATFETRSKNYFEVSLSLFRSQIESPQPQTYYTDLVRIENRGNTSQQVNSIFVQLTSGASSLGALTIFYCSLPSKDPYIDSNCASFTVNSTVNSGYLFGNSTFPTILSPGGVGYIGAAGFANVNAKVTDPISFQIRIITSENS